MPIHRHNNETQTQWDRGNFAVMVMSVSSTTPIGFCDGTDSDELEIIETANEEGTEIEIEKKLLKSGRQVWTIRPTAEI